MSAMIGDVPEEVLREWRTSILNRILALVLALGVLGVIIAAPDVLSHPGIPPLMIVSCAMESPWPSSRSPRGSTARYEPGVSC